MIVLEGLVVVFWCGHVVVWGCTFLVCDLVVGFCFGWVGLFRDCGFLGIRFGFGGFGVVDYLAPLLCDRGVVL